MFCSDQGTVRIIVLQERNKDAATDAIWLGATSMSQPPGPLKQQGSRRLHAALDSVLLEMSLILHLEHSAGDHLRFFLFGRIIYCYPLFRSTCPSVTARYGVSMNPIS